MKLKINNNYIFFSFIVLALLIDSALLLVIKENKTLFLFYVLVNLLFMVPLLLKQSSDTCIIISILMTLFYTFFIDAYIHYFNYKVIFEAEFLFLVPLIIGIIKTHNKNSKLFVMVSITYLIFNFIIMILEGKVAFFNYSTFMVNILSFIFFYYIFSNIEITKKYSDLMNYIFLVCCCLTLVQTIAGFNTDTRNGIFSVFGFGSYTFFIMMYFLYYYNELLNKNIKIGKFIIILALCFMLYIVTESKAAIVMLVVNMAIISLIRRGISLKKVIIVIFAICMVPLSYNLLLKFNPKFAYLNNIDSIVRYYTGNNNWHYKYGRFEAIGNVYSDLNTKNKLIGSGFGSSTPLYMVFYTELGRDTAFPYYINKYGYYYGYQHTSTSTLILDGGLVLFFLVVIFSIVNLVQAMIQTSKNINNKKAFIKFGILIYFIYYFTYANVLKDFRAMAILGLIFGLSIYNNNTDEGEINKYDKNYNSI